MTLRPSVGSLATLLAVLTLPAAGPAQERYTTDNFVVSAPTKALAKTFGEYAEDYRKQKAIDWLGAEMKRWPSRCPLSVSVEPNRTGGETTFTFVSSGGATAVGSQKMKIFGGVEDLLNSVLPHEVTHTVFAQHFGQAVPRWADEGGSVHSENDEERYRHDVRCRELLNKGDIAFPLRVLFSMNKYPPDMHTLYAEGYSVVNFLVAKEGGRRRFLEFVGAGMRNDNRNWEQAARQVYDFEGVDDLQDAWLKSLKSSRPERVAKGNRPAVPDAAAAAPRTGTPAVVASSSRGPQTRTSPAGVPLLDGPVVARGVPPAGEPQGRGPTPPAVLPLPTPIKLGAPEAPARR